MNNNTDKHAGHSLTDLVMIAKGIAMQLVKGEKNRSSTTNDRHRGQPSMASAEAKSQESVSIVTASEGGEKHVHNAADLIKAYEEDQVAPGLEVVDSDIADDPKFEQTIREKLRKVGNNCFGDVGAALKEDPSLEDFSRSLVKTYFSKQRAQ